MAAKTKIAKDKGVEMCAELLLSGKKRPEILQAITKHYNNSPGCIDKWIKAARPVVLARQQEAEIIRQRETDAAITDSLKSGLKSDLELEVILCQLATDNVEVEEWVKGKKILRGITPFEVISAIQTLYKKRGSNAPIKTAQTDVAGNDLIWNETRTYDIKHKANAGA